MKVTPTDAQTRREERSRRGLLWVLIAALVSFAAGVVLRNRVAATHEAVASRGPVVAVAPPRVQKHARVASTAVADAGTRNTETSAVDDESDPRRVKPDYHLRDPREWQGMRVDMATRQRFCEEPSHCGHALGCMGDEGCGPCGSDEHCSAGERCVLDHCVLDEHVGCRTYSDCGEGDQCMLTGITPDARGNQGMKSICKRLLQMQPSTEPEQLEVPQQLGPRVEPLLRYQDLAESIRRQR